MQFILGDKLPKYYDVAVALFSYCPGSKSEKRQKSITAYTYALIELWQKAFGKGHTITHISVIKKIKAVLNHYNNHVYIEHTRTKPKKKGSPLIKRSIRLLNKEWRQKFMTITVSNKKVKIPIDSLFDIGMDMESLDGDEKAFYIDQQGPRIGLISECIDIEYLEELEADYIIKKELNAREEEELKHAGEDTAMDISLNESCGQLDVSLNRSGIVRKTASVNDQCVQVDSRPSRPRIRIGRNCTFRSKSACARVSVHCNISAEMSREAVRITCESMYDDQYYTSKEEAIEKDPCLETERNNLDKKNFPKPSKHVVKSEQKVPHKLEEWKAYKHVLPSAKTINNHKHVMAIQHERDAATALLNKSATTKVTLHYDATKRSKIDGDWPALILIFSNKQRFPLRPLFFAYEDRSQIVRLIIQTYRRLAATISSEDKPITAKTFWEKTTALMTDSVSKNLKIEVHVAESLESTHIPIHLLCKAHTVEAFDRSNLEILGSIEKEVEYRVKLETLNPSVRSFLRGKSSVVEAAITSILSLVSHDKSANSTNQADLFDFILQRENQIKHIAMYYERRFTKLGYSAASILQALPYLQMLLNESHLSNQHIEIVKMFLDSEFLITELQVLAYFTHTITLPFLYFVEVNSIEDLLKMFPVLHNDLKLCNVDTLIDYRVHYPHVKVNELETDAAKKLLFRMCLDAANVLERQAGREFGFGQSLDLEKRATSLHILSKDEIKDLPTHNLDAERHLSVFGRRAPVAKFRNKKFTGKGIRNNVVLFQSDTFESENSKEFVRVVKLLNEMEHDWVISQGELHKAKILEKIKKGEQQSRLTLKRLKLCKGWKGPATSVEELHEILKNHPLIKEKVVRTELMYYRDTHRADVTQQPDLFKVNNICYNNQLVNLCALLADQDPKQSHVSLPSIGDIENALATTETGNVIVREEEDDIKIGQYFVTLFVEGDKNTWYIASCEGINADGTYTMHQLMRRSKDSDLVWKQPVQIDKADLLPGSIVTCTIDGEWDVSKERNMTFTLRNHLYISDLVKNISDQC